MTTGRTRCAHCETPIADPTTQVVHGDKTYCCANCSSAMEQAGSGSDPRTRAREGSLRCAHCGVAIVHESSMQSRGNQAFCCSNCLDAIDTDADDASLGPSAEQLPADDRARQMR